LSKPLSVDDDKDGHHNRPQVLKTAHAEGSASGIVGLTCQGLSIKLSGFSGLNQFGVM
jgi:hypothetical protein